MSKPPPPPPRPMRGHPINTVAQTIQVLARLRQYRAATHPRPVDAQIPKPEG